MSPATMEQIVVVLWGFVGQADVIENWKATANIEADPVVVAGIEQGLAELEEGQGKPH